MKNYSKSSLTHSSDLFYLEFEKESGETVEIEVEAKGVWLNTGIGGYEFWGDKGFDRGYDYFVIEDWHYDKTGLSVKEINMIEKLIEMEKK